MVGAAAGLVAISCQKGGSGLSDDDGSTSAGDTAGPGGDSTADGGIELVCQPKEVRCSGQDFIETCADTGLEWIKDSCPNNSICTPCGPDEACTEDRCLGPCDADAILPSSAGCTFIANRQLHLQEDFADSVIVANPNNGLDATVKFWKTPEGKNKEELVEEIVLEPREDHLFLMEQDFVLGDSSMFRTGGTYRIESDVPVTAYQHAPAGNHDGTESSLLLPENVAGKDYVVLSYSPMAEATFGRGRPSYFEIVALEDYTTVESTPRAPTAGNGLPIDPVAAGETGTLQMNRFDTARIAASANYPDEFCDDLQDVSGTVIHADKPIWVVGASRCSRVPVRGYVREGDENDTGCEWDNFPRRGFCDPLQEVIIPIEHWGHTYIAPRTPTREPKPGGGPTRNHWRLFNGYDGANTITSTPPVFDDANCPPPNMVSMDGSDCTLPERGAWVEVNVAHDVSLRFQAPYAFMPVGYLQSRWKGCQLNGDPLYDDPMVCIDEPIEESAVGGDPAMYQLVPVEQFLPRYVLRTAEGYPNHYIQVIRKTGSPDIFIDSAQVQAGLYEAVDAEYEIANVQVSEGTHVVESGQPFGVIQIGDSGVPGHYDGCNYEGTPDCLATTNECDTYTDQMTCPGCRCDWIDGACVKHKECNAAYAYPGGMKSEQITIP